MKKKSIYLLLLIVVYLITPNFIVSQEKEDKYIWLEDVDSEKSLEWVNTQNKKTIEILKNQPEFQNIYDKTLKIYNSKDRIAYPSIKGKYIYNFWKDGMHKRGIWRRTLIAEYFKNSPNWETVIDFDVLSKDEHEKWAYKGATFLYPENDLCMVSLSRGGSDAVEIREFDLKKKEFVKNGFFVPQAKGSVSWIGKNTLIVNSDFGEGTTTTSGYPRIAKKWMRGTPLSEAVTLFEGKENDVSAGGFVSNTPERQYIGFYRAITFYTSQIFVMENNQLVKLEIPEDASFDGVFKGQILIELKSDWNIAGNNYKQGALLSIDYDKFIKGERNFNVVYQPDEFSSLVSVQNTKYFLLLNQLTNVKSELHKYVVNYPAPRALGFIGQTT